MRFKIPRTSQGDVAQNKKKTNNMTIGVKTLLLPALPGQQHRLSTASVQLGYAPSHQDRGGRELTNAGHAALFVSKTVAGCATLEKLLGRERNQGFVRMAASATREHTTKTNLRPPSTTGASPLSKVFQHHAHAESNPSSHARSDRGDGLATFKLQN